MSDRMRGRQERIERGAYERQAKKDMESIREGGMMLSGHPRDVELHPVSQAIVLFLICLVAGLWVLILINI